MRVCARVWVAGLCVQGFAGGAIGQHVPEAYTLVELSGTIGSTGSRASALSNTGLIVGAIEESGALSPVIWDASGALVSLLAQPVGATSSVARDVNDEGSVLVEAIGGSGASFVYASDGAVLPVPIPSVLSYSDIGASINARGDVGGVGYRPAPDDKGQYVGVLWERTPTGMEASFFGGDENEAYMTPHVTDSGLLVTGGADGGGARIRFFDPRTGTVGHGGLGDYVEVFGVNDTRAYLSAEYSGSSGAPGDPYLYVPGSGFAYMQAINCDDPSTGCNWYYYDLEITDHLPVRPRALNEDNVVVGDADVVLLDGNGEAYDREDDRAAIVWSADTGTLRLSDLVVDGSDDGWALTSGVDINDAGWIVGNGTKDGQPRSFLLIPREPCAADTNRDGLVTPADFTAWISAFNAGCD